MLSSLSHYYARKQLLLSARLSHRNSVCPSVCPSACDIFSIERRFGRSKFRFSRFKETCARGHQRAVPP